MALDIEQFYVGARYLASNDTYVAAYGPVNSARNPPFNQLDVRVDKTWTFDRWTLTSFVDLLNAYDHQSIEGIAYSYDYSQSAAVKGLPIFPSFGVKGEF